MINNYVLKIRDGERDDSFDGEGLEVTLRGDG
jgi:hypothetical protein